MKKLIPLTSILLALNSPAEEITWTATGTVSSVTGSGFTAAAGNPVSVKVSYQTGLKVNTTGELSFPGFGSFKRCEFPGDVGLKMEVTIGTSTWSGEVASDPLDGEDSLVTEAWDGNGDPDSFVITASSTNSGTFSPFPFSGSETARLMSVAFKDATSPAQFIQAGHLPMDWSEPLHLTQATGVVQAGSERINFTLTPSSVKVTSDAPTIAVKFNRTANGVELRWMGEDGVNYQVQECNALGNWVPMGLHPGFGVEIVVPIQPFVTHPTRRFYRVVTLGAL